ELALRLRKLVADPVIRGIRLGHRGGRQRRDGEVGDGRSYAWMLHLVPPSGSAAPCAPRSWVKNVGPPPTRRDGPYGAAATALPVARADPSVLLAAVPG